MDFKKLADKVKKTIDERGGMDSLKADAEELKQVAKGEGSLTDKAKAAAQTIKDPGAAQKRNSGSEDTMHRDTHTPAKPVPPHE